jgi:hypothetical protein
MHCSSSAPSASIRKPTVLTVTASPDAASCCATGHGSPQVDIPSETSTRVAEVYPAAVRSAPAASRASAVGVSPLALSARMSAAMSAGLRGRGANARSPESHPPPAEGYVRSPRSLSTGSTFSTSRRASRAPSILVTPVPSSSPIDPEVSTTSITGSRPEDDDAAGSPGAADTEPGTASGAAISARTTRPRSRRFTPRPAS